MVWVSVASSIQDVRQGSVLLRRHAVRNGGNTAIFSLLKAAALRDPLPYREGGWSAMGRRCE